MRNESDQRALTVVVTILAVIGFLTLGTWLDNCSGQQGVRVEQHSNSDR